MWFRSFGVLKFWNVVCGPKVSFIKLPPWYQSGASVCISVFIQLILNRKLSTQTKLPFESVTVNWSQWDRMRERMNETNRDKCARNGKEGIITLDRCSSFERWDIDGSLISLWNALKLWLECTTQQHGKKRTTKIEESTQWYHSSCANRLLLVRLLAPSNYFGITCGSRMNWNILLMHPEPTWF